jgi:phenylacetate-CoA ligase
MDGLIPLFQSSSRTLWVPAAGRDWRRPMWRQLQGWLTRQIRQGPTFRRILKELESHTGWSAQKLHEYQDEQLRRLLLSARDVPHYQDLFQSLGLRVEAMHPRDVLTALPLLDKDTVRQDPTRFLNSRARRWTLRKAHTSGTSGTPLVCWRDMHAIHFEHAALWRQWRWAGVQPTMTRVTLRGELVTPTHVQTPPFWRWQAAQRQLTLSSYHLNLNHSAAYRQAMETYRPEVIEGYPSSVYMLAQMLQQSGLSAYPARAILTSSETLLDSQRQLVEKFFQCRVYDHYGNTERTNLIQTTPEGQLASIDDYGLTEWLPTEDDPHTHEIVGTPFFNHAFILIRYRTGDWATLPTLAKGQHPAAYPFQPVTSILGRTDAFVLTPEGARIGRMDHVLKGVSHVVESRIIQETIDHLILEVVPAQGWSATDAQQLLNNTRERVGPTMRLELREVQQIPRTSRGKFVAVVSRLGS